MKKEYTNQEFNELFSIVNLVVRIRNVLPKPEQDRLLEEFIKSIDLFRESASAIKMFLGVPFNKDKDKVFACNQLLNKEWVYQFIYECLNSGLKPKKINEWLEKLELDFHVTLDCAAPVLNYVINQSNSTDSFILPIPAIVNGGRKNV